MNDLPLDHRIGSNNPPEPIINIEEEIETPESRIAKEIASADEWRQRVTLVDNEADAKKLADKLDQLEKLFKKYDAQRDSEKRPHDEKAAAVQARWKPLLDKISVCIKALKPLETAWNKLCQQRLDAQRAAARRAAEEERRRADQLAEQAKAGGPCTVTNMIAATEATRNADRLRQEAAAVPAKAFVQGNFGGRKRSLRTAWFAQIVEPDLVYRHFREHAEVKDLLQRLANAAARGGVRNPDLPGCYVYSEEQ
jgi:hypothetical protein